MLLNSESAKISKSNPVLILAIANTKIQIQIFHFVSVFPLPSSEDLNLGHVDRTRKTNKVQCFLSFILAGIQLNRTFKN